MNSGLDYLGAELAAPQPIQFGRTALALAAGALAAVLSRKHPVLAFLGGAAVVSNTHAVLKGERTWKQAVNRMGKHVVASVASLSVPKYPALGYVAGAVAGDMLLDGEGGGIIEEFADYEGIKSRFKDAIDVEYTETKTPGTALQKVT